MPKQNQAAEAKSEKKRRPQVEPVAVAEPASDVADLSQWAGGPLAAAGDGTIQGQSARLGNPWLQSAQRQALAAQIGRLQGNRHLQMVVASVRDSGKAAPFQPKNGSGDGRLAGINTPTRSRTVQRAAVPGLPSRRVRQAEANLTSDPQAAVNAVVQGLVDRGRVNVSYLAGGRVTYVSDRSRMPRGHYGHTSLTPGTSHPRPCRVIVGPDAMRNVGLLYTTIMHEYQHVLQFRTSGRGVAEAVDEVEARLWEVEHLQDSGLWRDIQYMAVLPGQLQHWWDELTSTQQRPLRARHRRAQAMIQQMNRRRLEEQFRQQTGGGSAAARTVQRQDALGPPPELAQQIAYAQAVLSKVPPLPADQAARLSKTIAGAPVYEMMKKRDEKRTELENLKEQVRMEAGARPTAGREEEITELAGQIEQMDKVIKASLGALGLTEEDLAGQVEGFVEMWVERGKEIAITMLEQNERVVDDELNRYSTEFTPMEGTSTAEVEGLQNADRELQPSYLDLKSLKETVWEEEEKLRVKRQGPPPEGSAAQITGWRPPTPSEIEYVEDLKKQLRAKNEEMKSQLQTWGSRYPILLSQNYTPGAFANRSPKEVGEMTGSWIQEIKENIIDTKANIQDEDIKVWHLHHVPAMTFQSLGVSRDSLLGMAVNEYIQDKKSDAAALETALTVFQAATIVAAAVAGGPAGAALVSAGWGVFDLVRHIDDYLEETAAEEVALDPFKDISALEPSLIPIALDIISLGIDIKAAPAIAKSLGALRSGRKTAREFIEGAVSKGLSRKQAKVLAGKVAAHASDVGKIRQVAEAAYRAGRAAAPSLDDVIKNVTKKAEPMVAEWVKKNRGNIFFYGDIKDQLGYVEFDRLRRKNPFMFQWGGFEYRGKVFLNPAGVTGDSIETLSGWLVHEVTHILTEKYVPGLHKFWQEFLGFKMQQRYLRGIQESLQPSEMEWLIKMSDHELSYHVATTYKTYRPSDRRTYERAISQVMAIFRHAVKM